MSTGKAWEARLEAACRGYHVADRALVWRCHPPVRVCSRVGGDGQFRARWDGRGPCDFAGILRGPEAGRCVAFDAKDCEGPRWSFGGLEEHQAQHLEGVHRMGGLAFVALRLGGSRGEGWVLPWAELGPRWWAWHLSRERARKGAASFSGEAWGVRMPEPGDWLGALSC